MDETADSHGTVGRSTGAFLRVFLLRARFLVGLSLFLRLEHARGVFVSRAGVVRVGLYPLPYARGKRLRYSANNSFLWCDAAKL